MNRKGFTLVELLAVVVVIALLITMATPAITSLSTNAQNRTFCQKVENLEAAALLYAQERYAVDPGEFEIIDSSESNQYVYIQAIELVQMGYIKDDDCKITYEPESNGVAAHYTYEGEKCLEDPTKMKDSLALEYINIYKYGQNYVTKFDYTKGYEALASVCNKDAKARFYINGIATNSAPSKAEADNKSIEMDHYYCEKNSIPAEGLDFIFEEGKLKNKESVVDLEANNCTIFFKTTANYTIMYDANGGSLTGRKEQTKVYGEKNVSIEKEAIRQGYIFQGWATTKDKANRGEYDYLAGQEIRSELIPYGSSKNSITLYAAWKKVNKKITYVQNGGNCRFVETSIVENEDTILNNYCSKDGYEFKGWNTKGDGKGTMYSCEIVTEASGKKYCKGITLRKANETARDLALYAIYEEQEYTLTCTWRNEENQLKNYKVKFKYSEPVTVKNCYEVPVKNDKQARGWSYTEKGTIIDESERLKIVDNTNEITIYAVWLSEKYAIDLGTGTTFNVKTLLGLSGEEAASLTKNNFYFSTTSFTGKSATATQESCTKGVDCWCGSGNATGYAAAGSASVSASQSKSYNTSSGVLTWKIDGKSVHAYYVPSSVTLESLGSKSSYDLTSKSDYTSLTNENFLIKDFPSSGDSMDYCCSASCPVGMSFTKTYNASTGKLSSYIGKTRTSTVTMTVYFAESIINN